jgi:hypothetical protein
MRDPTMKPMRRLAVLCLSLAILAVPAVAAGYVGSNNDGTLSVRDGVGVVWVGANGALVGRFDKGTLRVFDPADGDLVDVNVWGDATLSFPTDTTTVYTGSNLRFRIVGRFRVTVKGSDIDLTGVGQGKVGLKGTDGTYAFNGRARHALPDTEELTPFDLSADTIPPDAGP